MLSKCWVRILILAGVAAFAQEPTVLNFSTVHVRLRAKVLAIVPVDGYSGTLVSTSFDPRFAVTLRIESIDPKVAELVPGTITTFGIHSPTLLFLAEKPKGRSYALCLDRKEVNGKVELTDLAQMAKNGHCLGSSM